MLSCVVNIRYLDGRSGLVLTAHELNHRYDLVRCRGVLKRMEITKKGRRGDGRDGSQRSKVGSDQTQGDGSVTD